MAHPRQSPEYIHEGEKYGTIKKIYSVNIIYFDLGQGKDYVYHGKTQFKGIHFDDILKLSTRQREQFVKQEAGDIFPEYYVLRVNEFDEPGENTPRRMDLFPKNRRNR